MESQRIKSLKSIAEEIASAEAADKQIELLTKGFELFSQETERLDQVYLGLKEKFRAVNKKLTDTNERLAHKVQELHVLTRYLDNILSHMAQGLIFIDSQGHITTYNRAAEAILEKPRNEVLFQLFQEHFPPSLIGHSLEKGFEKAEGPKTVFTSIEFPDGRQKELEVEMTPIFKKGDESSLLDFTEGWVVLLRDISELRYLQMVASRNDRMKALGEMAAQVAHEIRNPLGGIKGFASLLQRDLKDYPEQLKLAHHIVEGTNTLDRLVDQVLNYSRPIHLELKGTDLRAIICDVKQLLEAEKAIDKRVQFIIDAPKSIFAPADAGLLVLSLRNLAINGLQAMPEGGDLKISLKQEEQKALIEVRDTGIGIPSENLKKIFSPFFTTKADGNGLGLAEVHKVIQAHGGEIAVESKQERGTTFTIKLPLKI